ncbi:DUF4340 domain-containing protein [Gallaecimonas sp. GXIMD4217]|uniref:DUF4340 domain-containing protein n=1 Tax=Gallaecimonas sp. GXIMD4217 TaxID=3131927 RepID=UPI00311AFFA8
MSKLSKLLAVLLLLQLGLAAALWGHDRSERHQQQAGPLLTLERSRLDSLTLSGPDGSLTLVREDGRWRLPGLGQLPVNERKLERALDQALALEAGWPVASTAASHGRFKVAEEGYERRLSFKAGNDELVLLLGSSPAFRLSHVRLAGSDAVYQGEISAYQWPLAAEDWLDKGLLALDRLTRIQGGDFALEHRDEQWTLAGDGQGDATAIQALVGKLRGLRVSGWQPELPAGAESAGELTVNRGDQQWHYRFSRAGDSHFVERGDHRGAFTLASGDFDRLARASADSLSAKEAPAPEPVE